MTGPDYSKRVIVAESKSMATTSIDPKTTESCAYCGATLEQVKCAQCGRKARSAEKIQGVLHAALGDRYSFISILGAGGFAEVYKAKDTVLERDVAIKRLKLDTFADEAQAEELRSRALREAQVAARLNHPNIVTIHDIIDRPKMNFIVMEFIDGDTLEGFLRKKKRLSLDETIEILSQTADALDYAHSKTVIHRDIKPANIMLDPSGRVKVTDFGIAKSEASPDITSTGSILGTPNYMSPEQARGNQNVNARSDLYSMGCVLYECLAGKKAFRGKGAVDILMKIINSDPPALDAIGLDLHDDVNVIVKRALAKDPKKRYSTATEIIQGLCELPRIASREVEKSTESNSESEPVAAPVVTRRDPNTASSFDLTLQGNLKERSVPELFRLIYAGRKTGILHITQDKLTKRAYFIKGSVVFANSDAEEDRLGKHLVRKGVIDQSVLDLACGVMTDTGQRLGKTLVELGSFDDSRLNQLVEEQVQTIVYSLFQWNEGYFGFELMSEPVEEDIALNLSTADTIMEGVRRIESVDAIREALGNTDRLLIHTESPLFRYQKMNLNTSEGYVLSRVDGTATVDEIVSISPLGERETLRCVFALVSAGVLELEKKGGPPPRRPRPRTDVLRMPEFRTVEAKAAKEEEESKDGVTPKEQEILDDITTKHGSLESVNFYELLEIQPTATAAEVKKAYKQMAKRYHPDLHHTPALKKVHGLLEELFVKIQRAYECLSDDKEREYYDLHLPKCASSTAKEKEPPPPVEEVPEETSSSKSTYIPPDPSVLAERQYRAAKAHYSEMSYYDAISCARDAIRYVPDKAAYHKLLAQALAKNPKWNKQAEEHFKTAIKLDAYDTETQLCLAMLYEGNGMNARALKIYEKVLDYDPDNKVAYEKVKGEPNDSATALGKLVHLAKLLGRDKNDMDSKL